MSFEDLVTPESAFFLVVVFLAIVSLRTGIQRVPEGRARLVERFGRFHRTLMPGLHFVVPFIDRVRRNISITTYRETGGKSDYVQIVDQGRDIHLSEQLVDPAPVEMIAKDNAIIYPDVIGYFKIIEPQKAVYAVENLGVSIFKLLETTLRQEIGKLDSDAIVSSRDVLSAKVQGSLEEATNSWGVRIMRVEIQEIRFDPQVQQALSRAREEELLRRAQVVRAQQERDTNILIAEGRKKAQILDAEGEREATVHRAQGVFEAQRLKAEGDYLVILREKEALAKGYEAINAALRERPEALVALEALKAQQGVAEALGKSSNMMIVPSELAGLLGAIGSIQKGLKLLSEGSQSGATRPTT